MRLINQWFNNSLLRLRSAIFLEDALLTGKLRNYGLYRLRYFFWSLLFGASVHIVEFFLLREIFEQKILYNLLALKLVILCAGAFYWGSLEVLRNEVRVLYSQKKNFLVPERLAPWFVIGAIYFAVLLGALSLWLFMDQLVLQRQWTILKFYLAVVGFNLALELPLLIYHSSIYSIRRIFRPFWSLISSQIITLLGTVLIWPYYGVWSFPAMTLLGIVIGRGLTAWFVHRLFKYYRFYPVDYNFKKIRRQLSALSKQPELLSAGLASMSLEMELLLPLLAYLAENFNPQLSGSFTLLFLLAPFIKATKDWSRLFYFDFKKLMSDMFTKFRKRFVVLVRNFSIIVAVVLWFLAALPILLLQPQSLNSYYLTFLPILILLSILGLQQIEAFSSGNYRIVSLSSLLLMSGFIAVALLANNLQTLLLATPLLLGLAVYWLFQQKEATLVIKTDNIFLWLKEALAEPVLTNFGIAKITAEYPSSLHYKIAKVISRVLSTEGRAILLSDGFVIWYERSKIDRSNLKKIILTKTAGLTENFYVSSGASNTLVALEQVLSLYPQIKKYFYIDSSRQLDNSGMFLKKKFKKFEPEGIIFDLHGNAPAAFSQLSSEQRRQIVQRVLDYVRDPIACPVGRRLDAAALVLNQEVRLVFVTFNPKSEDYHDFRNMLTRFNLTHPLILADSSRL